MMLAQSVAGVLPYSHASREAEVRAHEIDLIIDYPDLEAEAGRAAREAPRQDLHRAPWQVHVLALDCLNL